jgi:hypothetical protein
MCPLNQLFLFPHASLLTSLIDQQVRSSYSRKNIKNYEQKMLKHLSHIEKATGAIWDYDFEGDLNAFNNDIDPRTD